MSVGFALETQSLSKSYGNMGRSKSLVRAVIEVNLAIRVGETFGLVGESGSGKTTLTRLLLGLEQPSSGRILFCGEEIDFFRRQGDIRKFRRSVAAVFQNPHNSFNPRMRVWQAVTEAPAIAREGTKQERYERAQELLGFVQLSSSMADRFPHQLSGGQLQRAAIARALAQHPSLVILDEPLSALDVSVSADIVNLLLDLQNRLGLTYLFVGHDLRLMRHLSHRVAVMYRGRIVEQGDAQKVLRRPEHEYTKRLVRASVAEALAERAAATHSSPAPVEQNSAKHGAGLPKDN